MAINLTDPRWVAFDWVDQTGYLFVWCDGLLFEHGDGWERLYI